MDDPEFTNRARKTAGRQKLRNHVAASRGYLHSMTSSKLRRAKEALEKREKPTNLADGDKDRRPEL